MAFLRFFFLTKIWSVENAEITKMLIFSLAKILEISAKNPIRPNGKIISKVRIFQSLSISIIVLLFLILDWSATEVTSFLSFITAKEFGKAFLDFTIANVSFHTKIFPFLK